MEKAFLHQRALALWLEAQHYQSKGDLVRAIDLYTKSIRVFPTAEAHTFRGWAYGSLRRFEDAIEECRKAIEIDPEFGNAYNDIGSYLVEMNRTAEALDWFEKAKKAQRYETRQDAYINCGRIYAEQGMLIRAIREFESALHLAPGEPTSQAAVRSLRSMLQ